MDQKIRWISLALVSTLFTAGCGTVRGNAAQASHAENPVPDMAPAVQNDTSIGHHVLWYIPNRLLDLVDIFRLRLRAGPGLSAHVRMTDYANLFIGQYYTAYLGLPGPRMAPELRWPVGWEYEKGLMLMGVDATDDLPHEPAYASTECNIGLQLLLVGIEAGFDPVELGDFFAGFVLIDVREDDR